MYYDVIAAATASWRPRQPLKRRIQTHINHSCCSQQAMLMLSSNTNLIFFFIAQNPDPLFERDQLATPLYRLQPPTSISFINLLLSWLQQILGLLVSPSIASLLPLLFFSSSWVLMQQLWISTVSSDLCMLFFNVSTFMRRVSAFCPLSFMCSLATCSLGKQLGAFASLKFCF